jgi:hypothetical protein
VIHQNNLHLLDDLLPEAVRERMRTRTSERKDPVSWQKRLDGMADLAEQAKFYVCAIEVGSDYTADEIDAMKAIDYYKRRHCRPHPTWREVLAVLAALGWERRR